MNLRGHKLTKKSVFHNNLCTFFWKRDNICNPYIVEHYCIGATINHAQLLVNKTRFWIIGLFGVTYHYQLPRYLLYLTKDISRYLAADKGIYHSDGSIDHAQEPQDTEAAVVVVGWRHLATKTLFGQSAKERIAVLVIAFKRYIHIQKFRLIKWMKNSTNKKKHA